MTTRWVQALWLALVLGLTLGLAACDGAAEPDQEATRSVPSLIVLTNRDWPVAHADPAAAVRRQVVLRARVYSVGQVGDDLVLCGWVDFDNDQLSTVFRIPGAMEGVERDAFVWVEGTVMGRAEPGGACGDAVHPEIKVTHLTVTDRVGVRPALRVVQVGQALEWRGVRAVLERVEFAEEETRIYFTLENRGDETLMAFATGLGIEVDGTEIPALIPIGGGIRAPRGQVAPGAIEHGGFQFPALDPDGSTMTVRWRGAHVAPSGEAVGEWIWVVDPAGTVVPEG